MASTKDVLDHHLKAFDQGDLNGILSDYAPDAVFFTKNGALKGVDKIRPLFEALIAEFGKPGATFNVKQQLVEADYAYILWTAETADNVYELVHCIREKVSRRNALGGVAPGPFESFGRLVVVGDVAEQFAA
jgi:SnoaL-like domain